MTTRGFFKECFVLIFLNKIVEKTYPEPWKYPFVSIYVQCVYVQKVLFPISATQFFGSMTFPPPPPLGTFPKIHPIWYRHPSLSSLYLSALLDSSLEWVFDPYLTILLTKWKTVLNTFCLYFVCPIKVSLHPENHIFSFLRYLHLCWNNVRFRV